MTETITWIHGAGLPRQYFGLASFVVLLYDHLLTLDDEVCWCLVWAWYISLTFGSRSASFGEAKKRSVSESHLNCIILTLYIGSDLAFPSGIIFNKWQYPSMPTILFSLESLRYTSWIQCQHQRYTFWTIVLYLPDPSTRSVHIACMDTPSKSPWSSWFLNIQLSLALDVCFSK